jgi:ABC-type polysaccharide/polyol phosphate transport system ATPase subunit
MTQPVLIRAENVSKRFSRSVRHTVWHTFQDIAQQLTGAAISSKLRPGEFWALQEISFEIRKGESVAVIGDNGAGKSTLIKLLMRRMLPTTGLVETTGSIGALTVLGLGFDPVLSGRENIILNAATLGLSRSETMKVLEDIIDFAELREFIDTPIQTYSSGMKSRLGYAVAAHVNPDVLLLDEVLAVGDIRFRRKCRRHIKNFIDQGGTTLLVTHDLQAVQTICTRCMVLEKGRLVFDGSPTDGIYYYLESQIDAAEEDPHLAERIVKPPTAVSSKDAAEADAESLEETVPEIPESLIPEESLSPDESPVSEIVEATTEAEEIVEAWELVEEKLQEETESIVAPSGLSEEMIPAVAEIMEATSTEDFPARGDAADAAEKRGVVGGDVIIELLTVHALDGQHLRTGHPAEFVMRYRSSVRIDNVAWGFSVVTEDGLVSIGTFIQGYSGKKYNLRPGRHSFRVRVDRFPFHAGRYGLKAGIGEVDTGAAIVEKGWEDEPVIFHVRTDPSPENSMHAGMNDLVVLEGQAFEE